jgi:GIY-YIG catalytic domain
MRSILVVSFLLISSQSSRSFHHSLSRYGSTCRLQCTPLPSIEGLSTAILEDTDTPLVTIESSVAEADIPLPLVTTESSGAESSQITLESSVIEEPVIFDQVVALADSIENEAVKESLKANSDENKAVLADSDVKDAELTDSDEKEVVADEKEVVPELDPYVEYDNGRLKKEDLPHLPGVYVLELENNCIYVGKSNQNVEARVKEHFNSGGSAFTKRFKPIRQLQPLTQPSVDLESYERAETLEQMWVHGIKNVRGWQYTKLFLSEFEYESVFRQMCERKDLCR